MIGPEFASTEDTIARWRIVYFEYPKGECPVLEYLHSTNKREASRITHDMRLLRKSVSRVGCSDLS